MISLTRSRTSFSFAQRAAELVAARLRLGELLLERLARRGRLLRHRGELDLELRHASLGLVELDRRRVDLHPETRRRLVDEVDRLVGQEAVGDVAVGEHGRGDERRVADPDAVVRLVALLEAAQDPDRVGDRRLADEHRLEATLERGVLLDVRSVLVERRRADRAQLAAREHRLEQVPGGDGALGRARTDDRVELVDEEDDLPLARGDLLQHGLEALLELAAVLRAGDERADVERPDALALQPLGHVARDDSLREPLRDRGLADPRLADQHRVVLRTAREHLDRPPDLLVAADHGVELPLLGERRQVAPVLLERLVRALGVLRRDALAAAHLLERGEERLARDDPEREQQVLDRDELVAEPVRLVEGGVEHAPERRRRLWLRAAAGDGRLLREPRLRLAAERVGRRAGALDERATSSWSSSAIVRWSGVTSGFPRRRASSCAPATASPLLMVSFSKSMSQLLVAGGCGWWYSTTSRRYCRWVDRISSRSSRSSCSIRSRMRRSSSSSRRTCSTPARLSPSSVVSRWTSRRRSTSFSE